MLFRCEILQYLLEIVVSDAHYTTAKMSTDTFESSPLTDCGFAHFSRVLPFAEKVNADALCAQKLNRALMVWYCLKCSGNLVLSLKLHGSELNNPLLSLASCMMVLDLTLSSFSKSPRNITMILRVGSKKIHVEDGVCGESMCLENFCVAPLSISCGWPRAIH